ncbi:Tartrate-resistant acid phosphatase type 5 [Durusdinium trenchii]|uniref:Tartrate-resistant acid phosphatase type 5 n=1 Tax=Durusdinium trenchii TaxID=1381693 RepID=A0ABP0LHY4_9DINO
MEAPTQRIEEILHWKPIQGIYYPRFFKESAIRRLQNSWECREGDVFLVSNFPVRGLQRVLTCMVEGRNNPWEDGLLDKPYYCDAAASRRGVDAYLSEAESWKGRRCFKTHAPPHLFPCRYPFPETSGDGIPPKILVLVADPRLVFTVWWQTLGQIEPEVSLDFDLGGFLSLVADQGWKLFGSYFDHAVAWAKEAEEHPESVRLCVVDNLGSLLPKDVQHELSEIAEFLCISQDAVDHLVEAIFHRPPDACKSLSKDQLVDNAALQGGHIVENTGQNLYSFQSALDSTNGLIQEIWRGMFKLLLTTENSCLIEIAHKALGGTASLPPLVKTGAFRGAAAHDAGLCRPCVFNLRDLA